MQRKQATHTTALKRMYNDRETVKASSGSLLKIKHTTQELHFLAFTLQKTDVYTPNIHRSYVDKCSQPFYLY